MRVISSAPRWPVFVLANTGGGGAIDAGQAPAPPDSLYFLSNEAPTANAVLTDDFRRGNWYTVDSDHTDWTTVIPGWGGTIFANPITPAGAIRNLQSIGRMPMFGSSDYAATTGFIDGVDGGVLPARNHAWHNLSGGGSGGYAELYFRYYVYYCEQDMFGTGSPPNNYLWGAQKAGTVNRFNDSGGIYWAGAGFNIGGGSPQTSSAAMNITNNHGTNVVLNQNVSSFSFTNKHWYFVEMRIKLNTVGNTDGIFQLWANDGGVLGDFSGQTPTLRSNHTTVDWGRTGGETQLMGVWWPENWSNPASKGEQLWKNFYISTTGPVGFAPAGTGNSYSTTFAATENPMSEGGRWIEGQTTGVDWGDFQTTGGNAVGTRAQDFRDNTAILTGVWNPKQYVDAVVFKGGIDATLFPEVEIRLRTTLTANVCSGYEIGWGWGNSGGVDGYLIIVRWNGAAESFDYLLVDRGSQYLLNDGDSVKATISGNIISAYRNGVFQNSADITSIGGTVYSSGNPGIGTNCNTGGGAFLGTYGFKSLIAGGL